MLPTRLGNLQKSMESYDQKDGFQVDGNLPVVYSANLRIHQDWKFPDLMFFKIVCMVYSPGLIGAKGWIDLTR